jgi:CrcB protein
MGVVKTTNFSTSGCRLMSIKLLLYIALGGALGSVGRYLLTALVSKYLNTSYPYGTMIINVSGSFALGCLLSSLLLKWSPSLEARAFLQVGVLGAFTTFSTFSMDAYYQITRGDYLDAAVYVSVSVVLGVIALIIGVAFIRQIFA